MTGGVACRSCVPWVLAGGMLTALPCYAAPDDALADAVTVAAALAGEAPQELYLEVSLNGEATGVVARFTQGKLGLRCGVDTLRELGLDPAKFGVLDTGEVELAGLRGLNYQYDAGRQRIALVVDDALRAPVRLDARQSAHMAPTPSAPGFVVNYDAYAQIHPQRSLLVANELRWFNARGVFSSTGLLSASGMQRDYLRYDTFWEESDSETLRSFQAGDLVTSSLAWNRSLRVGGLQWRKSFELRPDLVTFPLASLRGSAVVPSALSLYVNGVQQFSANVPSGPFVINQVAGISGAGETTLVTRDAMGRATTTVVPMYVDTRMLAPELSEYSIEAGFVRRGYGQQSFSYKASPVASASGRYGWSDGVTLEAHGEAAAGLLNAGAGALLAIGQAGVVNASVAKGNGGMQFALGYQYLGRRFTLDLQAMRAGAGFTDLAVRDGSPLVRSTGRATLSTALSASQSVSASVVSYQAARVASLSYSIALGRVAFFTLSGFKDVKTPSNRGVYFGLSTSFGDRISTGVAAGRQDGIAQRSVNAIRSPEFDGGYGWSVQRGDTGDTPFSQAQVNYQGRYGTLSGVVQRSGDNASASLAASGSIAVMSGTVAAARNVGGGFALVSTSGMANVPVVHENRQIGVTDASGMLLIPNLNPYTGNRIAIDPTVLPADMRVRTTAAVVSPRRLSGVLVNFPVERYSAATVLLHGEDGKPLPPGTPVLHLETGAATVVGYDGMAFIDNLGRDNHLEAGEGSAACKVRFAFDNDAGTDALPVIGPLACVPAGVKK
ncbi:MAG: fimbria/pilus outer membrane usher protein [Pseudomonadota bacterium]